MVKPVKPTPFKPNIEDWHWSEEVEGILNVLRDNIAQDLVAGTEFGLDAWLTDIGPDHVRNDTIQLQVYVFDDAIGESIAEKNFPLSELVNAMDLDPREVAWCREKFQRLAEEFETLAKRIRDALEKAKDIDP